MTFEFPMRLAGTLSILVNQKKHCLSQYGLESGLLQTIPGVK